MGDALNPLRCQITKNPVRTDTWKIGSQCECDVCRADRTIATLTRERDEAREAQLRAEVNRDHWQAAVNHLPIPNDVADKCNVLLSSHLPSSEERKTFIAARDTIKRLARDLSAALHDRDAAIARAEAADNTLKIKSSMLITAQRSVETLTRDLFDAKLLLREAGEWLPVSGFPPKPGETDPLAAIRARIAAVTQTEAGEDDE